MRVWSNSIGSRKISCLCLLDLSAAFDTTDHNILLTSESSWFRIYGAALNWFRSYLSSLCFRVKCNNDFSSPHTCLCGVQENSVLGPLLFVMYTTPLSTLVSFLALNHHLYHTLTSKQPAPLPPPSFILYLTTVTLYQNLPNCQLYRL